MTNLMKYKNLLKYFDVSELICPHCYKRDGKTAIYYLDPRLVDVLIWVREKLDKPIVVNNYHSGGSYSQRGFRCNLCDLVKSKIQDGKLYATSHCEGMAVDFSVVGMNTEDVKRWIRLHANDLPHPIRLESNTTTWIHVDVRVTSGSKIEEFNG